MKWTAIIALLVLKSNAQLMSPSEAVCPGNCVIFSCRQTAFLTRWNINLQSGTLRISVQRSQVGSIFPFVNDPGFHFEIHVVSNSSNSLTSELQVTAVRELNGVPVECSGSSGNYMSTIQVTSVDPPAAPSGVMTTYDQFTKTGASISVTWSTSSGADNYTIKVTPPMSNFTTTATSLQLIIVYNVNYSVNITAQNCAGSNSTIVSLIVAGCSPPSLPSNGSVNEYHSGSVGSLLTFQCNTGYIPHEQVTSTCLENGSWIPIPQCVLADCGTPRFASGVVIEPFNSTQLDATITFHCDEGLIPQTIIKAVCGSTGEWNPNPAFHLCVNQSSVFCSAPVVPTNVRISNQSNINSIYLEGTNITFLCDNGSQTLLTSTCYTNGNWSPSPSKLDCSHTGGPDGGSSLSVFIGISLGISFLLLFLIILIVLGITLKKKQGVKSKPLRDSNQDGTAIEYSETKHPGPRSCQNQVSEEYSVISHPATSDKVKLPGKGDTLIYADIGPSHSKRSLKPIHIDEQRVVYSVLNHASLQQPMAKKPEHDKTDHYSIDSALNLDSLLIQLKPQVTSKWKEFANVVGLSNIIKQLAKYSPDECIVEVCDQWLKSQPNNPTWRDVANVVKEIGLYQLANNILMAYETGELPITVDMDAIPLSDNEIPPPLPPKITEVDMDNSALSLDYSYHKGSQKYEYKATQAPLPPDVPARPPKS